MIFRFLQFSCAKNSQTKLYTKTAEYLTGIPAKKKKGKGI